MVEGWGAKQGTRAPSGPKRKEKANSYVGLAAIAIIGLNGLHMSYCDVSVALTGPLAAWVSYDAPAMEFCKHIHM